MKRKWLIIPCLLAMGIAGAIVALVYPAPDSSQRPVLVTFLAVTNDANGARMALFSATNGTERLFVRGRSEIEVQGILSNQLMVTQLTDVDYLQPRQAVSFSVPCPTGSPPWRLKFYFVGQLSPAEQLKSELGWCLNRRGFKINPNSLPTYDVRELSTAWIPE